MCDRAFLSADYLYLIIGPFTTGIIYLQGLFNKVKLLFGERQSRLLHRVHDAFLQRVLVQGIIRDDRDVDIFVGERDLQRVQAPIHIYTSKQVIVHLLEIENCQDGHEAILTRFLMPF